MRQSKTIFIIIFLLLLGMANNAQNIAGGGILKDWAHLKKFENENETLKKVDDSERIIFMGNSITEGWSSFNKDFFVNNATALASRQSELMADGAMLLESVKALQNNPWQKCFTAWKKLWAVEAKIGLTEVSRENRWKHISEW